MPAMRATPGVRCSNPAYRGISGIGDFDLGLLPEALDRGVELGLVALAQQKTADLPGHLGLGVITCRLTLDQLDQVP